MYRCQFCQQLQAAGVSSVLVPVQTRSVIYPLRRGAFPPLPSGKEGRSSRRRRPEDRRDDPGGHGYETVRELRACPACESKTAYGRVSRASRGG